MIRESYTSVLRDVGVSVKDLVQSEVDLLKAELKENGERLGRHAAQTVLSGLLMALTALPLMAFLIIGLGILLNERYWLSSLIITVVTGSISAFLAVRSYKKLKELDLQLDRSQQVLQLSADAVKDKTSELKEAM